MNQKLTVKTAFMALTALVAWFAIILQFALAFPAYLDQGRTVPGIIVQLFSYFTILSNLLVAIGSSVPLLKPESKWGRYFSSASVSGAIAVYIATVGITFNIILRNLLIIEGFSAIASELLHVVVPILYVIYWIFFAAKSKLKWNEIFYWLIYPLIYLAVILIRGAISGYYPYPFMNVTQLGYTTVAINSIAMIIGFVVLSILCIFIGRSLSPQN